jgi:hypothetical protein
LFTGEIEIGSTNKLWLNTGGAGDLAIGGSTKASAPFRVTNAGALTATSGTIGGWTLGTTSLTAGSAGTTVGLDSGGTNPAIYAGSATPGSAPFRVTNAGALTATSGTIGGWTLGTTSLTAGSAGTTVGLDSGGTNPAIYAGSATPGSAPFRVTNAGALTATSGTIGGWTLSDTSLTAKISSTLTARLETDGDAFFGWDLSLTTRTSLAIFSNDQTWNSKSYGAGDLVIGNNAAGHLHWDASAGQLLFRDGATTHAYVGTDGKITFGYDAHTKAKVLDRYGIALEAANGWDDENALAFYTTPATRTGLQGYLSLGALDAVGEHFGAMLSLGSYTPDLMSGLWLGFNGMSYLVHHDGSPTIAAAIITAQSSAGLSLKDDGGNLGLFVEDGGQVGIGTSSPAAKLHVAGTILIDGDEGGYAGTIGLTDVSNTAANSTGVGTIKFKGATNRDSTGFIKIYIGTTAYYVPVFAAITG